MNSLKLSNKKGNHSFEIFIFFLPILCKERLYGSVLEFFCFYSSFSLSELYWPWESMLLQRTGAIFLVPLVGRSKKSLIVMRDPRHLPFREIWFLLFLSSFLAQYMCLLRVIRWSFISILRRQQAMSFGCSMITFDERNYNGLGVKWSLIRIQNSLKEAWKQSSIPTSFLKKMIQGRKRLPLLHKVLFLLKEMSATDHFLRIVS